MLKNAAVIAQGEKKGAAQERDGEDSKNRPLNLTINELADHIDSSSLEMQFLVNCQSGDIFPLGSGLREEDREELYAQAGDDADLIQLPFVEPSEGYRWMEKFRRTVEHPTLTEKLDIALNGLGAFRRFRDVLNTDPAELRRWYAFKKDRLNEFARDRAELQGLQLKI